MRRQTSSSLGVLTRVTSIVEWEHGHQLYKGEVSADQITSTSNTAGSDPSEVVAACTKVSYYRHGSVCFCIVFPTRDHQ